MFCVVLSDSFLLPSRIGNVGPSLEYGGVAVRIVVSFSDEDAKMSLMRFGSGMVELWFWS